MRKTFQKTSVRTSRSVKGQSRSSPKIKPGSTPWHPTNKRLNAKPQEEYSDFRLTRTPTVYTFGDISKNYTLSQVEIKTKELFDLSTEYVHPESLDYKLPIFQVPEFAFLGKSNVGKSSLISVLVNDSKLVRVSKEPGCTRSVNFFGFINSKHILSSSSSHSSNSKKVEPGRHEFYLVDLPGYGFAKVSKTEKERWQQVIDGYITERDMSILRRAYLLIDSRHGIKENDLKMMLRLDSAAIPYQIVLTKTDDVSESKLHESLQSVFNQITAKRQSSVLPYVHAVSSLTGSGIKQLKQSITSLISFDFSIMNEQVESFEVLPEEVDQIESKHMSQHNQKILKALEANMKEEEEFNRRNIPKQR